MIRFFLGSLAFLALGCAAHNSHRVPLDLNAQLAPLIDEAWAQMETAWNEPVPVGGVPVLVAVEPVDVHWLPYSPEVPPGGSVLSQTELRSYIIDALRPQTEPSGPNAQREVRVSVATDLHHPDSLGIRVVCRLVEMDEPHEELARGVSGCLRFDRLYCHGCRDTWSGLGTELHEEHPDVVGYGDVGFWGGVIVFPGCSSGGGYSKH